MAPPPEGFVGVEAPTILVTVMVLVVTALHWHGVAASVAVFTNTVEVVVTVLNSVVVAVTVDTGLSGAMYV